MRRIPADLCRRCGQRHEELYQMIDPAGRWAMTSTLCECGHSWTIIHTSPMNLAALRAWMSHGCEPAEGPVTPLRSGPWQQYRLEGVCPASFQLQEAHGGALS